jgi:hypothetical protein
MMDDYDYVILLKHKTNLLNGFLHDLSPINSCLPVYESAGEKTKLHEIYQKYADMLFAFNLELHRFKDIYPELEK